jgi:hypothetical protein
MGFLKSLFQKIVRANVWARPQMFVTFRAEVMPGKTREERTFQIDKVLSNGRVILKEFVGEHKESAFEPVNFSREKAKNS